HHAPGRLRDGRARTERRRRPARGSRPRPRDGDARRWPGAAARMKPAPFEYAAPETLEEALELLAGDDAKALAGGQSLVPLLNFRVARPRLLVDLNRIVALDGIRVENGTLFLGALVRQAALERSDAVAEQWPLLRQAIRFVGHPQTRTRGPDRK